MKPAPGEAQQSILTLLTLSLAAVGIVLYYLCFKFYARGRAAPDRTAKAGKPGHAAEPPAAAAVRQHGVRTDALSASKGAAAMYFARYVLGDVKFLFTTMGITTLLGAMVTLPLVPRLVDRIGKKYVLLLGFTYLVGRRSGAVFRSAHRLRLDILCARNRRDRQYDGRRWIGWALVSDTVEYGEWRTGIRIEGLGYSFFSFSRKCGQAIGGSVPAFLLAISGYIPNLAMEARRPVSGFCTRWRWLRRWPLRWPLC